MVSVLMTVYQAGSYLPQAIDSVINQTYEDWELLIMDDGSTDPAVHDALDGLVDRRITIQVFDPTDDERRESVRYATLINWGAKRTTGRYVTYLCGDDYYLPDRLERMVARIEEGHDVVYGAQTLLRADGVPFGVRGPMGVLDDAFHRVDLNSVLHTRDSFERVGGWPTQPELWRDADAHMWVRLTEAGYRFVPVAGGEPTDCKHYRDEGVDARLIAGKDPWV